MQAYLTSWNIAGSVAGLVLSVAMIISLVIHRRQVGAAIQKAGSHLFSQIGFFSLVIVIFMIISVLESGQFFNSNITHEAIFGLLGYALALGFDLVSVVCMMARLNAQRMRDEHGSHLNLVGVIICAAVSAFANAAGSLQGYNPIELNHTPPWMQVSAPWLGMVFPALIVVLSMTTDHILDHTPARGVDVDTFRAHEKRRVEILQVRLDTEKELLQLETELATLRHTRERANGSVAREWFWTRWFRQAVPVMPTADQITQTARAAIDEPVALLQTTLSELATRFSAVEAQAATNDQALRHLATQVDTWTTEVTERLATLQVNLDHRPEQRTRRPWAARTGKDEQHGPENQEKGAPTAQEASNQQAMDQTQGTTAQQILATFQHDPQATDRQVARTIGCSKTTVTRWRHRFQEQGLLLVEQDRNEPSSQVIETPA